MTTWEVADVQWNPHPSRDMWVVSTSNQKALVWNLVRDDIEFILHGHSRAITDINWSIFHPEIVATCSIDTFVHCWDLRASQKPAFSFYSWNSGATQVKFNRQNEHLVASSHDTHLKIWDDRKGSLPLHTINAHETKIYGIDWSRTDETMIVTCSLDKLVKFWDISQLSGDSGECIDTIETTSPVWRARYTPFGHGVMTMPQRNETFLSLWAASDTTKPVTTFRGHVDTVKEFLWRVRGGEDQANDNRDFQLITWSKDHTLRLWPMEEKWLAAIGHNPGKPINIPMPRRGAANNTYIEIPKAQAYASDPVVPRVLANSRIAAMSLLRDVASNAASNVKTSPSTGGMKTRRGISDSAWMKGVKMYKSGSQGKDSDEGPEDLGQEVIAAIRQTQPRVTYEKMSMSGDHRNCTFTLNGPWGDEDALVFMRFHVSFPDGYPAMEAPYFDLDSSDKVPLSQQARIAEGLNSITEDCLKRKAPSFLACIRFLLREEETTSQKQDDEESDDESIIYPTRDDSSKNLPGLTSGRSNDSNVPLPRKCGAVFGGNNILVCFFPATVLHEVQSASKPVINLGANRQTPANGTRKVRRLFDTFGQIGSKIADTRTSDSDNEEDEDEDLMPKRKRADSVRDPRAFTRLVGRAFRSTSSVYRESRLGRQGMRQSTSASIVRLRDLSSWIPATRTMAANYLIDGEDPVGCCIHNARVAAIQSRTDAERVWLMLATIMADAVPLAVVPPFNQPKQTSSSTVRPFDSDASPGASYAPGEGTIVVASRASALMRRRDSVMSYGSIPSPKAGRIQTPVEVPSAPLAKISEEPNMADRSKTMNHVGLSGCVKWGIHPSGQRLIADIFKHYERTLDVQMLAMLTCILSVHVLPLRKKGVADTRAMTPGSSGFKAGVDYFSNQYLINGYNIFPHQPPYLPRTPSFTLLPGYSNRTPIPIPTSGFESLGSSKGSWNQHTQEGYGNSLYSSTPPTPGTAATFRHETPSHVTDSYAAAVAAAHSYSRGPSGGTASVSMKTSTSAAAAYHQQQMYAHRRSIGGMSGLYGTSASPPTTPRRISPYFGSAGDSSGFSQERKNSAQGSVSGSNGGSWGFTSLIGPTGPMTDESAEGVKPSQPAQATQIKVVMMNQDAFDEEKTPRYVPLLDESRTNAYIAYLLFYADLLYRWELHTARAEVLKFVHKLSQTLDSKQYSAFDAWRKAEDPDAEAGLTVQTACAKCQAPLNDAGSRTCTQCNRKRKTAGAFQCTICHVGVRGLSSFCLICHHGGHAAHYRKWFQVEQECPSGCGCQCLISDGGNGSFEVLEAQVNESAKEDGPTIKLTRKNKVSTMEEIDHTPIITDEYEEEEPKSDFQTQLIDDDSNRWRAFHRPAQQW